MHRFAFLVLAVPTLAAADCPPVPDRSAELSALFEAARAAPNEGAARAHANAMWEIWTEAPDAAAQELLAEGMSAIRVGDYLRARDLFDRLVDYCPDYAEGWNQRAFVHFLTGRHAAAVPDLERAHALEPRHTGILTGMALTLIALGREAEAQDWLREALALNPWLSERHLLTEPPGEEI